MKSPTLVDKTNAALIPAELVDVTFVDFNGQLEIPEDVEVFTAKKLDNVIKKYENVLQHTPQNFNMANFLAAIKAYEEVIKKLKGRKGDSNTSEDPTADAGNLGTDTEERQETEGKNLIPGLDI